MRQTKNKVDPVAQNERRTDRISRANFREALRSFRLSLESLDPDRVPEKYELLREVGRAEKLERLPKRGAQREKALVECRAMFGRIDPLMRKICDRLAGKSTPQ